MRTHRRGWLGDFILWGGLGLLVLGINVPADAQDRFNPNQPDFYTRPKVSPYVNMVNPLLGPTFMRYNFVKQEQETRAGITADRAALQEQQYQLEQQQKELEQERQTRQGSPQGRQSAGGSGRGLEDPRVGGPVRRIAHGGYSANRLKGHSYNTRPTGHRRRVNDTQVIGRFPRTSDR